MVNLTNEEKEYDAKYANLQKVGVDIKDKSFDTEDKMIEFLNENELE